MGGQIVDEACHVGILFDQRGVIGQFSFFGGHDVVYHHPRGDEQHARVDGEGVGSVGEGTVARDEIMNLELVGFVMVDPLVPPESFAFLKTVDKDAIEESHKSILYMKSESCLWLIAKLALC